MSDDTDDHCLQEIVKFVDNIIKIRHELLNKKVIDCNLILKRFGLIDKVNLVNDSGFESEPVLEIYDKSFIPSATFLSKFEANDLELIFEHLLKYFCALIQNSDTGTEQTKVEICVEAAEKCVCYLEEIDGSVPFREIIQSFLEALLENAMAADKNADKFSFVMELFRRFGLLKSLEEIILEILLRYIENFSSNLKRQKADATFTFCFETDFSRANVMLFVLLMIKEKNNGIMAEQDRAQIYCLLENFVDLDDFFPLGFLSYKCFLK